MQTNETLGLNEQNTDNRSGGVTWAILYLPRRGAVVAVKVQPILAAVKRFSSLAPSVRRADARGALYPGLRSGAGRSAPSRSSCLWGGMPGGWRSGSLPWSDARGDARRHCSREVGCREDVPVPRPVSARGAGRFPRRGHARSAVARVKVAFGRQSRGRGCEGSVPSGDAAPSRPAPGGAVPRLFLPLAVVHGVAGSPRWEWAAGELSRGEPRAARPVRSFGSGSGGRAGRRHLPLDGPSGHCGAGFPCPSGRDTSARRPSARQGRRRRVRPSCGSGSEGEPGGRSRRVRGWAPLTFLQFHL